jgi:chromosome segregation ATPase
MITTKAIFTAENQDDRSLEILVNAIEKSNLPGFDYYEFKRAVYTLLQMQLDEATAHKSAFTTAATVGVTKEKLIETATYYRNLLEKEKTQFDNALQHQNDTKVTARTEETKRLKDQIERHKLEIERLQSEMAQYSDQIQQNEQQVATETEKLQKAQNGFERTLASVVTQIDADIEKMHKYL